MPTCVTNISTRAITLPAPFNEVIKPREQRVYEYVEWSDVVGASGIAALIQRAYVRVEEYIPPTTSPSSTLDYELGFDYDNVDLSKYSYHLTNMSQKGDVGIRPVVLWYFELEVVCGNDAMERLIAGMNREGVRMENASIAARRSYGNEAFYSLPLILTVEEELYGPPRSPEEMFAIPFVGYNLTLEAILFAFDMMEVRKPSRATPPITIPSIEVEPEPEQKKKPDPRKRVVKRRGSGKKKPSTTQKPPQQQRRVIKKR
jgi:hypothetical protein